MAPLQQLKSYLPILRWAPGYGRDHAVSDATAAVIVTIMLIPQSLAYALLAGLPPELGLYASITPLLAYALFGTSTSLAVGPVAVVSLMTAAAIGNLGISGLADYVAAATVLALLSGVMLLALGLLRLGFLANFLSHPVIAGFITASAIVIATSQLKHVLGITAHGHTLPQLFVSLWAEIGQINFPTLLLGAGVIAFLFWVRSGLKPALMRAGFSGGVANTMARTGPVLAVVATTFLTWVFGLDSHGVAIVGDVPAGLPGLSLPGINMDLLIQLAGPAFLISVIGFVESVSVAQTLAAKRRQRIRPDQELVALGASNVASAASGGFPVTGGFARSVVNFDAGSATPAAGAFTAIGIALAALFATPLLYFLPKATLAATIIVAVLSLVDLTELQRSWRYSKADFSAVAATITLTLLLGVEMGVSAGVALSIVLFLYRTSRPHIAEVGVVPGTQHFRNILRHNVQTDPAVLSLRVDESLYFANARYLEDFILQRVVGDAALRHVVLMCSAVNEIDGSALESLEAINERLGDMGLQLHLSEVKGPVMDRLVKTRFLEHLSGQVHLSQFEAQSKLRGKAAA